MIGQRPGCLLEHLGAADVSGGRQHGPVPARFSCRARSRGCTQQGLPDHRTRAAAVADRRRRAVAAAATPACRLSCAQWLGRFSQAEGLSKQGYQEQEAGNAAEEQRARVARQAWQRLAVVRSAAAAWQRGAAGGFRSGGDSCRRHEARSGWRRLVGRGGWHRYLGPCMCAPAGVPCLGRACWPANEQSHSWPRFRLQWHGSTWSCN